MTTLIAVVNSEGCVGRCDAKCHNSTGDKCECVCGGKFHGMNVHPDIQKFNYEIKDVLVEIHKEHPDDDVLVKYQLMLLPF